MLSSGATSSNIVSSDAPEPVPVSAMVGCARQLERRAHGLEVAGAGVAGGIEGGFNVRRNPTGM